MKKSLFLILAVCFTYAASAQKVSSKAHDANKAVKKVQPYNGTEVLNSTGNVSETKVPASSKDYAPVIIGSTVYDLQTNTSIVRRLVKHSDGTMSAGWIRGMESAGGFPDRGTGFNYHDGSAWGTSPEARIEPHRTGWPAMADNGTNDVVITHGTVTNLNNAQNSAFGAADWAMTEINPTTDMPGPTWPKAAFGGPDGQTIHVIASTFTDVWEGIEGNVGYFRSTDGGATWDIAGEQLEGVTSALIYDMGGESYSIDAKGETVAIMCLPDFGDQFILKSTDNGDSWTKINILDFPDDAEPLDPNTEILDMNSDGVSDTLETTDGCGTVVIDNNGMVHAAFGLMRRTADGGSMYYPYSDGLSYWNEDMGEGVFSMDQVVDGHVKLTMQLGEDNDTLFMSPDLDGDDTIHEFAWEAADPETPWGQYYQSLTTMPQLIVGDVTNSMILVYATLMEGDEYAKLDANPGAQNFMHFWASVRTDDGTWSEPTHVTSGDDFKQYEHIYPMAWTNAVADAAGGTQNVQFIYQMDDEPGLHVIGDEDGETSNYIMAVSLDVADSALGMSEIDTKDASFTLMPNPANNNVTINSEANAEIVVYNIVGAEVIRIENAEASQLINVSELPEGTYIVKVKTSNGISAEKLVVR